MAYDVCYYELIRIGFERPFVTLDTWATSLLLDYLLSVLILLFFCVDFIPTGCTMLLVIILCPDFSIFPLQNFVPAAISNQHLYTSTVNSDWAILYLQFTDS